MWHWYPMDQSTCIQLLDHTWGYCMLSWERPHLNVHVIKSIQTRVCLVYLREGWGWTRSTVPPLSSCGWNRSNKLKQGRNSQSVRLDCVTCISTLFVCVLTQLTPGFLREWVIKEGIVRKSISYMSGGGWPVCAPTYKVTWAQCNVNGCSGGKAFGTVVDSPLRWCLFIGTCSNLTHAFKV